jgi:hypothetical protein
LLADSDWSERFLPKGLARIQRQANQLMTVSAVAHPLEDIVAGADRTHQALPIGAPLLKPGFSNLLGAAVPLQVSLDVTTRFSVIAGDAVGMQIIFSHDAHVGLAPPSGIAFSEILRPAAFSPL